MFLQFEMAVSQNLLKSIVANGGIVRSLETVKVSLESKTLQRSKKVDNTCIK